MLCFTLPLLLPVLVASQQLPATTAKGTTQPLSAVTAKVNSTHQQPAVTAKMNAPVTRHAAQSKVEYFLKDRGYRDAPSGYKRIRHNAGGGRVTVSDENARHLERDNNYYSSRYLPSVNVTSYFYRIVNNRDNNISVNNRTAFARQRSVQLSRPLSNKVKQYVNTHKGVEYIIINNKENSPKNIDKYTRNNVVFLSNSVTAHDLSRNVTNRPNKVRQYNDNIALNSRSSLLRAVFLNDPPYRGSKNTTAGKYYSHKAVANIHNDAPISSPALEKSIALKEQNDLPLDTPEVPSHHSHPSRPPPPHGEDPMILASKPQPVPRLQDMGRPRYKAESLRTALEILEEVPLVDG